MTRYVAAVLSLLSVTCMTAHAQYSMSFDQSNVFLAPNATTTLNLYLNETGIGVTGSYLSSPGIVSVGAMLVYQVNAGTASQVVQVGDIVPNNAFDQVIEKSVTNTRDGNAVRLQLAVFANPTVVAPTTGVNAHRILVGSFTFTAGSLGSVTTIRLRDPNNPPPNPMVAAFANTVTDLLPDTTTVTLDQFNGVTPLYPLSTANPNYLDLATITVAVPEPAVVILLASLPLLVGVAWWYLRRRSKALLAVVVGDEADC